MCIATPTAALTKDCPTVNGISDSVLYNARVNVTAYPVADATPTDTTDLVVLTGDYTVASGKPFKKLPVEVEMSDYKFNAPGAGFGPYQVTAKLFVKGSKKEAKGVVNALQYQDSIVVLTDPNGVRIPIGNAAFPCKAKASFDSKTVTATDPRGWEIELTSYSLYQEELDAASVVPLT